LLQLVPTPIGNLGDITIRSLEALASSEVVFCEDSRVTKQLLRLLTERYPNFFSEKDRQFIPLHHHNSRKVLDSIDIEIFARNVIYVTDAGVPSVSDPGVDLVNYAKSNGIEFEVLLGGTASTVATVLSGFADRKTLFWGFLPHKGAEREAELNTILNSGYTVTLYESPHRLLKLLKELSESAPDRDIFLVKEISKKFEKRWWGTADEVYKEFQEISPRGEWAVVIRGGEISSSSSLSRKDIEELKLQPKVKAKLISKITGEPVKDIYNSLIEG